MSHSPGLVIIPFIVALAASLSTALCSPYIIIRMWQRLFILFTIQCLDFVFIPWLVSEYYLVLNVEKANHMSAKPMCLIASGLMELGFRPLGCCMKSFISEQ